ncbi:SMP-30/gluconolactonase/LRE family protein [Chondromyces crocatus]|uniref:Gluconolactonase n=1 Tax=Chondromyces crocatus TaxID=52 RepID=A0A0K1EM67_CHOCO|nr:SMP-30/gluconolactonase/LRE family protein [Chondromyces crocatus]AKT41742.1 gluconolactonase [Chondromyces crocatus]
MRFLHAFALGLPLALLAACGGDDDGSSTTTTSTTSTTSTSGDGGSGGQGGQGGGTGGNGGQGGQAGGMSWEGVNPIEDIDAVSIVSQGHSFTEGTCWFPAESVLRFTDIPNSRIHQVSAGGDVTVWREPSGQTNGLALTPNGEVIACEHANRRVTRTLADGTVEVVAERYQNNRFNSPNDAIVRSDGTIYFTDPTYGLGGAPQEINFRGVFRVALDGTVSVVSNAFTQPNGIALSPDEKTLYVTDSQIGELHRFPVEEDGSTGPGERMLDGIAGPDGMAVDDGGNLYLTTGNGVLVLQADGTTWGTIPVPQQPSNCAFGDADRRTLYISARTSVYKVRLGIPGKP